MEWTGLNELRRSFLEFFQSKEHLMLPSFSLIPQGDNSLLLINSGMAPMKKYFTGEVTPPRTRVTTCQKCIRTGDIDNVGYTARHGTFFEMLGNFSFGDYFKHESTAWAWEYFTQVLKMPKEKLYISVYEEDDETYDIWTKEVGVDPSHMKRLGKEDNFWEHGSGPCGPCSELYFDRGEKYGCGKPDCGVGCDCDRFVEIWNLVFSQFNSDGNGNYPLMEHPNIDTGMGLERLACVMQGVDNLFLVDTVQNIMKHVSKISGVEYGSSEKTDVSLRVITDHIRSTVFMIGDGVLPSNEGRGYVLRRLLRRAARHGKLLGIDGQFLCEVAETAIRESMDAYPELDEKRDTIKKVISFEEESFAKTIDQGLAMLNQYIEQSDSKVFSGEYAFTLNDTFGFPLDLTKEILAERDMTVDEDRFRELMREQKERARNARKDAGADAWKGENSSLQDLPDTVFAGYTEMKTQSKILAVIKDGERAESASEGEEVSVVLDTTPFYGESGGQVGDSGSLEAAGAYADVIDTTKYEGIFIHRVEVTQGAINVGDTVSACVDAQKRYAVMRNHTAAHLLQAALRKVLGSHVEQAGQLVNADRVRFDFTHFSAMTAEELAAVENTVNNEILSSVDVQMREMPIDEARQMGAMALFGEKYGDVVRVVSLSDGFSMELCGGTHMDNTARLGLFKILSESSVASGVRRIEGVTGEGVLNVMREQAELVNDTAKALKIPNASDAPAKAAQLMNDMKEKDRLIESLTSKAAASQLQDILKDAKTVEGIKVVCSRIEGAGADSLRAMCDKIRDTDEAVVAVFAGAVDSKVTLAATCSKAAQEKGVKAGVLVKEVAVITGGNGGGKPDFAMAGAKDPSKLQEAFGKLEELVKNQIG